MLKWVKCSFKLAFRSTGQCCLVQSKLVKQLKTALFVLYLLLLTEKPLQMIE
jgi:hypothetical protein